MDMKLKTSPILVVGSGLAGLTMALTLKKSGVSVEIISPNYPKTEMAEGRNFSPEVLYGS